MGLLEIQDSDRKELSEIHDCDACHGKIVCISVDNVGVTRCGYCNAIVNYENYYRNLYKDEILELIENLKTQQEVKKWQKKNLKKRKQKGKKGRHMETQ